MILFSLYLFIMALDMFIKYFRLKNKKYLILALIAILVGLLLLFNPGRMVVIYMKVTGLYLIVVAVLCFIELFKKNRMF